MLDEIPEDAVKQTLIDLLEGELYEDASSPQLLLK